MVCLIIPTVIALPLYLQTESEGTAAAASTKKNFIDQYFGVEFETSYPCDVPNNFIFYLTANLHIFKWCCFFPI